MKIKDLLLYFIFSILTLLQMFDVAEGYDRFYDPTSIESVAVREVLDEYEQARAALKDELSESHVQVVNECSRNTTQEQKLCDQARSTFNQTLIGIETTIDFRSFYAAIQKSLFWEGMAGVSTFKMYFFFAIQSLFVVVVFFRGRNRNTDDISIFEDQKRK